MDRRFEQKHHPCLKDTASGLPSLSEETRVDLICGSRYMIGKNIVATLRRLGPVVTFASRGIGPITADIDDAIKGVVGSKRLTLLRKVKKDQP